MKFSESPDFLNKMANMPGIFEIIALSHQDRIDLSLMWDDCMGIECEEGAFLCHCIEPGFYEVHTLFLPGRHVFQRAIEAAEMLFCATDCREIVTRVPVGNHAALALTEKFGWNYRYTVKNGFHGKTGIQDTRHYTMTLWDWILKHPSLEQKGKKFHAGLEKIQPIDHGDDPIHEKFVGYACLCADYGNKGKGVYEYNKWALLSGYQPVQLMADGNIMFDNILVREVA